MKKVITIICVLYLSLFIAHTIYLLCEAMSFFESSGQIVFLLRGIFEFSFICISFLFYISLFFVPHIPKKVVLPPLLFLFAFFISNIFFSSIYLSNFLYLLIPFTLHCVLIIITIFNLSKYYRNTSKVSCDTISAYIRSFFSFLFSNLFLVIPFYLLLIIFLALFSLKISLQDALFLDSKGIYINEFILNNGEKDIYLIPMAHIGEESFYQNVTKSLPKKNAVILSEGVSDTEHLLQSKFDYKHVSSMLGIADQKGSFLIEDSRIDVVHADLDVSDFSSVTIKVLNLIGRYMNSRFKDTLAFLELNKILSDKNKYNLLFTDILDKRNRFLLKTIKSYLPQYNNIIIPWGAKHIPYIRQNILSMGFKNIKQTKIYLLYYSTIYHRFRSKMEVQ